jgi:hypothetical protein
MAKNKHVDLFKEMIPSVDLNIKDLWDAATDDGRKEIKGDLWNLNRYISSVKSNDRNLQEHFVLAVNEFYNKNWVDIQKHPKLQWQSLCACHYHTGKTYFHEYIPFNKGKTNKLENLIGELYPTMKIEEVKMLAKMMTKEDREELFDKMGFDKKQRKEYE